MKSPYLLISLLFCCLQLSAQNADPVYNYADTYALFAGCQKKKDAYKRWTCSQQKMEAFLNKQLRFPAALKNTEYPMMADARLAVEKDGTISAADIIYQSHLACGEELERLIGLLPPMHPATLNGEFIRSYYILSVWFDPYGFLEINKEVFKVVDSPPVFAGCGELTDAEERRQCSNEKMLTYVKAHMPTEQSIQSSKKGMTVVAFIVEKDGSVSEPRVAKVIGNDLSGEALRLVGQMPKWVAGMQGSQPVRFQVNLPIKYDLVKE